MEMPGSWEPSVPSQGARPQGAWHEDAGIEGTVHPPGWNPGPGYGGDGVLAGGGTVSTVPVQELGRRVARFLAISALAGLAAVAGLITLAVVTFRHGGTLAALLVLLGVPALLGTLGLATALWVGRRAWRRGGWLGGAALAGGVPRPGRGVWAVRAALVGRAFWRRGQRARRPWRQARTGDLSGTTR